MLLGVAFFSFLEFFELIVDYITITTLFAYAKFIAAEKSTRDDEIEREDTENGKFRHVNQNESVGFKDRNRRLAWI